MALKTFYVVSELDKALAFEWVNDFIDKQKIDLHFILIGKTETPFITFLRKRGTPLYVVSFRGKKDMLTVWRQVFHILLKEKPLVVHTHLWIANLVGLTAAWVARVPQRIYTRHHATLHYGEYPSGRKWDKLMNQLATSIVAVSKSIEEILVGWDGAQKEKVHLIHHGFDWRHFENVSEGRINALRSKYDLQLSDGPVVGVISRYTSWKGVQFIIAAFKNVLKKYAQAHLILANARGDYSQQIKLQLTTLPAGSYTEITFEDDLGALYQLFDVYVHAPIDAHCEAFGQTYIEALAAGIPSVFTLSGVATEFVRHRENAWVADYQDSAQIYEGIIALLENPQQRREMALRGRESICQFGLERYIQKLEALYLGP